MCCPPHPSAYNVDKSSIETQFPGKLPIFLNKPAPLVALIDGFARASQTVMGTDDDFFHLFRYYPNLGAALVFVVLFGVASIYHSWAFVTTRTWFFTAFTLGCWCQSYPSSPLKNNT